MSELRVFTEDGVTYDNYANETGGDVNTSYRIAGIREGENSVISHKNSVKPFAYLCWRDKRWYKVKDTIVPEGTPINQDLFIINPRENHGYRRYNITTRDVDFNRHIKFFYTDDTSEDFIEIPQGIGSINVGSMMVSAKLKNKLLYFTETVVPTTSACSLQGGKNKHKSYRRKRQQRRSKRRQSKRIQRKSK